MLDSLRARINGEVVVSTMIGSVTFWLTLFELFDAFGHPFTDKQQHAIAALGLIIAGVFMRSQVSPVNKPPDPNTVDLTKVGKP